MSASYLATLLQIRLLVGYLGERAQFAWWPTAFYEPSSQLFPAPVFSKTPQFAQYHGVTEAARLLHDEHLNVGSYHLFRFPEEVEQDSKRRFTNRELPTHGVACNGPRTTPRQLRLSNCSVAAFCVKQISHRFDFGSDEAATAHYYEAAAA